MTPPVATEQLPVAVIGAGPVGLAAAAHLRDRGLPFVVLEAGPAVGASVREWSHVRTFTPWQYLVDPTAERLLAATGWERPTTPVPPTGAELVEHYLEPLAHAVGGVRLGARVTAVTRDGYDKARTVGRAEQPFVLRVTERDADGVEGATELRASAVVDASGTWTRPNPLGASGLPVPGEREAAAHMVGALPDVAAQPERFAGRRTLVVGAGHSAANTLLALDELAERAPGTELVWAIRGADPSRVYGGGDGDELAARGALGSRLRRLVESGGLRLVTGFAATAVEPDGDGTVAVVGTAHGRTERLGGLHAVAVATGFRPDLDLLSEVRLDLDPGLEAPRRLAPLIDPAFHSCGTVPPHGHRDLEQPEPGLYVVGMKSYGRAPTFLVTTGNEQVRSVVAALAGDLAAADDVQLVLPETGVCSTDAQGRDTGAGGCCGTPGVVEVPAEAHRARPAGVAAQGFATGVAGGGAVGTLTHLATPSGTDGACGSGGCCTT